MYDPRLSKETYVGLINVNPETSQSDTEQVNVTVQIKEIQCNHMLTVTVVSSFFSRSVATEGPETRQHCDIARYHPHGKVAHTGLRVPGETNQTSALTSCMTHMFSVHGR